MSSTLTQIVGFTEPPILPVLHDCLAELRKAWRESGLPVVLVATTSDADQLPVGILGCFKHDITFEVCTKSRLRGMVESRLSLAKQSISLGP